MNVKYDHVKLERAAILKGLNATEVAQKSNVAITTVRIVFMGGGSWRSVKKIAEALEVPMEELILEKSSA